MKKLFKLEVIGSIASIIALLFFLYFQFIDQEEIIIEVQTINNETLTTRPTDNNLTAQYFFNNIPISRLEKMHFLIKNIGNRTIIGQGNQKDLLLESLPFYIENNENKNYKILDIEIINIDSPCTLELDSLSNFNLSFKQWESDEYVEIIAYIQNNSALQFPKFLISERDILETEIIYTQFQIKNERKKIIDFFSLKIQNVLFWSAIILFSILIIITISEIIKQIKNAEINSLWFKITMTIIGILIILIEMSPFFWIIKL